MYMKIQNKYENIYLGNFLVYSKCSVSQLLKHLLHVINHNIFVSLHPPFQCINTHTFNHSYNQFNHSHTASGLLSFLHQSLPMATSRPPSLSLLSLVLLATAFSFTTAARTLNEDPEPPVPVVAPTAGDVTPLGAIPPNPASSAGAVPVKGPDHTLTFFMHDILGGSNPSAKAVTGAVTNPAVNGQVAFAKPNIANLPVNNGVPQDDGNKGIINNNNLPFLTGLGGINSNVFQNGNNGNNNNNNNVFAAFGGQLPQGNALQQFMFGTLTVIDDELTEGHELGSGLIGKAQGFYVSSSLDGKSQTMAFTVMFEHGSYIDSLSFMGVHRSAVAESQLAVMGGTGKYVNAKGHAVVKTFQGTNQQNNDGMETLLHFTVYLAY